MLDIVFFVVRMRTGSSTADINRFRRHTGNTFLLILILNLFPGELETGLGNLGLGKQTADEVRLQKMKEKAQVQINSSHGSILRDNG